MVKNGIRIKLLNNQNIAIHAGKDEFQRVELWRIVTDYKDRRFGVRMIVGIETAYLSNDVDPCSRREAVDIYTHLIDELDKDNEVIDLRPVLQNILDKRKEDY